MRSHDLISIWVRMVHFLVAVRAIRFAQLVFLDALK
jgi:hypothetical protein